MSIGNENNSTKGHRCCKYFTKCGFLPPYAPGREALVMNGTGFLTGRKPFLSLNQQCQSTEGNAKH